MAKVTLPVLSDKAEKLNFQPELRDAMARIKRDISERLQRGVDTQERPFHPYSPRYAERRRKSGRESGRVTLQYTGKMLRAIQAEVKPKSAKLFIRAGRNEAVYGAAHQEGNARLPRRRWWGASKKAWSTIRSKLRAAISRKLHSAQSGTKVIGGT